jgi:cbb3-type cytochrome oxidase maturation protein
MYYPYFITYMIVGIALSLVVFFWALKQGQFKDQDRARFLALADGDEIHNIRRILPFTRYEGIALFLLACIGLGLTAAVLIRAVLK